MQRFKGGGTLPSKANLSQVIRGFVGGFASILLLSWLSKSTGVIWLMAPFGASCVLLFAVANSPLAQPRNVIGGHVLSAFIGLAALFMFGDAIWVMAIAVGLTIALMQALRIVHPPAGANPLVIIAAGTTVVDWWFLVSPVLLGSIALVVIATIVNNIGKNNMWPSYWHGFGKRQ